MDQSAWHSQWGWPGMARRGIEECSGTRLGCFGFRRPTRFEMGKIIVVSVVSWLFHLVGVPSPRVFPNATLNLPNLLLAHPSPAPSSLISMACLVMFPFPPSVLRSLLPLAVVPFPAVGSLPPPPPSEISHLRFKLMRCRSLCVPVPLAHASAPARSLGYCQGVRSQP